jgi:hypothetical protein
MTSFDIQRVSAIRCPEFATFVFKAKSYSVAMFILKHISPPRKLLNCINGTLRNKVAIEIDSRQSAISSFLDPVIQVDLNAGIQEFLQCMPSCYGPRPIPIKTYSRV